MHLLDHEAPGLAKELEALPQEKRRKVLCNAAAILSQEIADLEPRICELLEHSIRKNALSVEEVNEVKDYAESADAQHFISDELPESESLSKNWFAKARLGMAIANTFGGDSWQDAADAAYELCFVLDDKAAAISSLRAQIEGILGNK